MQDERRVGDNPRFDYMLACIIGIFGGPLAISLVNVLLHLVFAPTLFNDGQYFFVFFFYVPQGAWLGFVTAISATAVREGSYRQTGIFMLVSIVPLVIAAFLFGLNNLSGALFYFGIAFLWSSGLCLWAIRLLAKSKPSADEE